MSNVDSGIIDYSVLPPPTVVEEVNYDTIKADLIELFRSQSPEYGEMPESDPIMKLIGSFAYREMYLAQRINSAAQAQMLPFATGPDLDMLGTFYEVRRNVLQEADATTIPPTPEVLEGNESYRLRIRDAIRGSSTAGSVYYYRRWATQGQVGIQAVQVYSPRGGQVNIAVMSTAPSGIPTDEQLAAVNSQVQREDVKVLTDTVIVEKAVGVPIQVHARIKLFRETPQRVFDELQAGFATRFNSKRALAVDRTRSWLTSQLYADGVYGIELISPAADVIVNNNEFAYLDMDNLVIEFAGRGE